ncbi:MAG: tetratricopeptide repeat protein [Bacteroidales bacterium]|nr:tetratricopeptide repeat protein [Candidatus Egerieousia equi]
MKRMRLAVAAVLTLMICAAFAGNAYAQKKVLNLDSLLQGSEFVKIDIPQNSSSAFLDGVKYLNQNDLQKAKENFNEALNQAQSNESRTAALFYLGKIAVMNQDVPAAHAYLEKALENDSTNFWCLSIMGKIYAAAGQLPEAEKTYNKLIKYHPQDNEAYYELMNLYARRGEFERCFEMMDRIEAKNGRTDQTIMTRYNIYRAQQNMEGAFKFMSGIEKADRSPFISCIIGDLYAEKMQDSTAMAYYNEALEEDPNFTNAIYGQAEIYKHKGDYQTYFRKLTTVMASPSISAPAKTGYLHEMFRNTRLEPKLKPEIDSLMMTFYQAHPADTSVTYLCASYFYSNNDTKLAKQIFSNNKNFHPDDPLAAQKYILALFYDKDYEGAEAAARESMKDFQDSLVFPELLAYMQYQQKKYDQTLETYKLMLKMTQKSGDKEAEINVYSQMADIYYKLEDQKECFRIYKKVIKMAPDHIPSLNNYAYFLSEAGKDLKNARKMSQKTIEAEPDNPTYLDTYAWIAYLIGMQMDKPDRDLYLDEAIKTMKHAMLYGGKESDVILDHYATMLYATKEYELAFIYWEQAAKLAPDAGYMEKLKLKKIEAKQK